MEMVMTLATVRERAWEMERERVWEMERVRAWVKGWEAGVKGWGAGVKGWGAGVTVTVGLLDRTSGV